MLEIPSFVVGLVGAPLDIIYLSKLVDLPQIC